jgi:hypothetical protein
VDVIPQDLCEGAVFADKPVDELQIVQGFYRSGLSCLSFSGLKLQNEPPKSRRPPIPTNGEDMTVD